MLCLEVLEGHPTRTLLLQPLTALSFLLLFLGMAMQAAMMHAQQTGGRYIGTALVACWHGWIFMDPARLRSVTTSMACSMLRSKTSHPCLIVMHQPRCHAEALLLRMLYVYVYIACGSSLTARYARGKLHPV